MLVAMRAIEDASIDRVQAPLEGKQDVEGAVVCRGLAAMRGRKVAISAKHQPARPPHRRQQNPRGRAGGKDCVDKHKGGLGRGQRGSAGAKQAKPQDRRKIILGQLFQHHLSPSSAPRPK